MHGTVMKITENCIVVLCEDGKFRNLPHPPVMPRLGDKILVAQTQQSEQSKRKSWFLKKKWVFAASFLLLVGVAFVLKSLQGPTVPVALVAIDINPSIELFVNKKGSVEKANLINEDAKSFMSERELQGRDFYHAVQLILSKAEEQGYLDSKTEKKWIWVSVVDLGNAPFHVDPQKITDAEKDYEVELFTANRKQVEKAKEADLSLNKYIVYEQVKEKGIDLKIEELRTHSIVTSLTSAGINPERLFDKKSEPTSSNQPQESEGNRIDNKSLAQESNKEPTAIVEKEIQAETKQKEEVEPAKMNPIIAQNANKEPNDRDTTKQNQTQEPSGKGQEQLTPPKADKPPETNRKLEIQELELTVKLAADEKIKLVYKNKDGKVEAKVEKKSKQGEERQQGEKAVSFVTNVIDRLALTEKIDKTVMVDRILSALKIKQKQWSEIEFHVEFSSGKELEFEYENPMNLKEEAEEKKKEKDEEDEQKENSEKDEDDD